MSLLSLAGSRKRKSSALGADGKEEIRRDPKRPRICMRETVAALSDRRMDANQFVFSSLAAQKSGGSADIVKATVLGRVYGEPVVQRVAVKKFRLRDDANRRAQNAAFANELHLLSELCHDNIVRLLGFAENAEEKIAWVVLPWEANGNLREFVQSQDWAIPERLSLIYDVACGIEYLHSRDPPICHADLKSLNILVNSDNHAIITDFGSARKLASSPGRDDAAMPVSLNPRAQHATSQEQGQSLFQLQELGTFITLTGPVYTLRWAAPEVLRDEAFGLASDIWAFGWICWEIMTGNIPFDDLHGDVAIILRVTRGVLPIVTSNEHISQVRALCKMMTRCWAMDPMERPAARECETIMNGMSRVIPTSRVLRSSHSAPLLCALGYMSSANAKPEEAVGYFSRAISSAYSARSQLLAAAAALGLGSSVTIRGNYSEAEAWCRLARRIFNLIGYKAGVANAEWELGEIYRLQGGYPEAEESYTEARQIYTQTDDQLGVANAELGLGDIYRLRDEFPAAEASYLRSREIYTKNQNDSGVAHTVWALGEVYRLQGEYLEAEASYAGAREIYIRTDDQSGIANTEWGLGEIYRLRGELSKAETSYTKAREIYTRIQDEQGVSDAVWGLGEVYRLQSEYNKADAAYNEARELSTRIGYQWGSESAVSSLVRLENQPEPKCRLTEVVPASCRGEVNCGASPEGISEKLESTHGFAASLHPELRTLFRNISSWISE